MAYFVEEKLNRAGQVIDMSQIQYTKNKLSASKMSRNKLVRVAESDANE